jgi:adenylate cyclase
MIGGRVIGSRSLLSPRPTMDRRWRWPPLALAASERRRPVRSVPMAIIHFRPDRKAVQAKDGQTILQAALKAGIPHTHACGGNAKCSTCRVMITEGIEHCSEPTWKETRIVKKLGFTPSFRLGCQTKVEGGEVTLRRLVMDPSDVALTDARDLSIPIGEERDVTVLFCDIRNFTPLAESLLPYDVIHLLNRFHYDMARAIDAHSGVVTVTMGDGLMALFGSGEMAVDPALTALQAVRAALDMVRLIDECKPDVDALYGSVYDIGIGIHCGRAIVGYMGKQSVVPTAIGDCVNVASRIEGANKQVGTRILVSEDLYERVAEFITIGKKAALALKGKTGTFNLYEVTGIR